MDAPNGPGGDWVTLLSGSLAEADRVPAGYKTLQQLMGELKLSETTLRRKLPALEAQGKITKGHYRVDSRGAIDAGATLEDRLNDWKNSEWFAEWLRLARGQ